MKRRLLTGILSSTLILTMGTMSFASEITENTEDLQQIQTDTLSTYTGTCGANATWEYNPYTETMTISGTGDTVNIEDLPVQPWDILGSQLNVTHLVVEEGITRLGSRFGFYFQNLTTITLPSTLETIDTAAFWEKNALKYVILPEGLTKLGSGVFSMCRNLEAVLIPSTVTDFSGLVFASGASNTALPLEKVVIYGQAGSAAEAYAQECGIPFQTAEHFPYEEYNALIGNRDQLETDFQEEGGFTWTFEEHSGTLTISGTGDLLDNFTPWVAHEEDIKTLVIEDGITYVGKSVFEQLTNLETVYAYTIEEIAASAFQGCSSLETFFLGNALHTISSSAFYDCPSPRVVYYAGSEEEKESISTIDKPTHPSNNDFRLFNSPWVCDYDITAGFPDSVQLVTGECGEDVRYSFDYLTGTLVISGTGKMTDYSNSALNFYPAPWNRYIDNIMTVVVEEGVTTLGNASFVYASNLSSVSLPDTLLSVGATAFENCSSLTTIEIPHSVETIGGDAFRNCKSLSSFTIPDSVATIGGYAFLGCTSLTSMTIPETVTNFGYGIFYGCTGLTSFVIPDTMTSIPSGLLRECTSLTSVYIPSTVQIIETGMVQDVTSLTTVYYEGTEADKAKIEFEYLVHFTEQTEMTFNEVLDTATWICNSTMPDSGTTPSPEPTSPNYAAWAEPQVNFSQENGLTVDSLGLDYTKNITRLQIADLLVNMVEKATGETLPTNEEVFTDTSSEAVSKASKAGIISGKDVGIFAPNATATRQEISIMIVRAIEKLEEISGESYIDHSLTSLQGFADFSDTADWAKSFVAILANNGIMSGSDGNLTPLSATSIQECLVLNNNLFQLGK